MPVTEERDDEIARLRQENAALKKELAEIKAVIADAEDGGKWAMISGRAISGSAHRRINHILKKDAIKTRLNPHLLG